MSVITIIKRDAHGRATKLNAGACLGKPAASSAALNLPDDEVDQAWRAVDQIKRLVESRLPPFDEIAPRQSESGRYSVTPLQSDNCGLPVTPDPAE